VDPALLRSLGERIEQLEQRLRRDSPAYAQLSRLQQVSLEQVQQTLRRRDALTEYVFYRPPDLRTKKWGEARYGVFVLLGGSGEVTAIDLGEAAPIDAAVGKFRIAVRDFIHESPGVEPSPAKLRRSEAQIAALSSDIRARVWQPIEARLSGVHRVYVAPDGLLSVIPFEALAREDGPGKWRYLVEDKELIYLNTGRDLGRLALSSSAAGTAKTAVLIGDPAFDANPRQIATVVAGLRAATPMQAAEGNGPTPGVSSTLAPVSGGETPRLEVPRPFPRVDILERLINEARKQFQRLGWSVTTFTGETAVEEEAESVQAPRILQFATHGYILDRRPDAAEGWDNPLLRSMLILAGANDPNLGSTSYYRVSGDLLTEAQARQRGLPEERLQAARVVLDDGLLTAYEATGLNLQGTDLVNLTACETGLGEVTPDGVAGLRQAFLLAGARSLTASMWEVPADETTAQMSDFYERWLGSEHSRNRYQAFRAAQLAALARARDDRGTGHPFYWAGLVYVGDPGDLPAAPVAPLNK
jgi:CHAT domain-containing protein